MAKTKTNVRRKRGESAANPSPIRDESATNLHPIRYAFVPLSQQFRSHTKKNDAKIWIPIECSLLIRYEFAALSPQTRYIFVAILLYCGMRGINEIPLDSKFMSSALIVDERTLKKSFDELLFAKLLLERKKEREKENTDRQTKTPEGCAVCVDFENFSEEDSEEISTDKTSSSAEDENPLPKKGTSAENGNGKNQLSQFSIEECLKYVEKCKASGEAIQSPKALANHLFKTGEADAFILQTLYPQKQEEIDRETFGEPRKFSDEPCVVCLGAKMADTDGKGYRKCLHCRNEKGISTGFEPKGADP